MKQSHLIETEEERRRRRLTIPGQASWGEGPETCRECSYWKGGNRNTDGQLRKAPCQKAQMMMPGLPAIPHWAPRCKYFTRNASPPEAWVQR